jgi:hypothetical protein
MVLWSNLWSLGVCDQVVAPSLSYVDSKGSRGLVERSDHRYDDISPCHKLVINFPLSLTHNGYRIWFNSVSFVQGSQQL